MMDHIHDINQAIQKSGEYNKPMYLAFIDYENTFDSVKIAAVMKALRDHVVEEAYIRLLEDVDK